MDERDSYLLEGNIVDVVGGRIFPGRIAVIDGRVESVTETPGKEYPHTISPGLVDAHVHVESSMLSPAHFGSAACVHGTVASVSDPHEIANVLGIAGVEWMLEDSRRTPFKIFFGAPSCVPATAFETAGAELGPDEIDALLAKPEIRYLSEVMNFPAVIQRDSRMMEIIERAQRRGKRIDGHAPGVLDEDLKAYAAAGIETDHECTTIEEGRQRCELGMKVAIREGSAAKNFDALWPLLKEFPDQVFFCSDDKHPDDLLKGHINDLVVRAMGRGVDPMTAFQAATLNPVHHYGLPVGLLQPGDPLDAVEWDGLGSLRGKRCWINGRKVAEEGTSLLPPEDCRTLNRFRASPKTPDDFALPPRGEEPRRVMIALDGQLLTEEAGTTLDQVDPDNDLLKITVVNRYADQPPACALIRGFGMSRGALASSVAHDSHNIVAVGTDDDAIAEAVNLVISNRGGLSACIGERSKVLPLPIAGLMSTAGVGETAAAYEELSAMAREAGCKLTSPYMTLSFMALLVIPSLKLSDKGLFDVNRFSLVDR